MNMMDIDSDEECPVDPPQQLIIYDFPPFSIASLVASNRDEFAFYGNFNINDVSVFAEDTDSLNAWLSVDTFSELVDHDNPLRQLESDLSCEEMKENDGAAALEEYMANVRSREQPIVQQPSNSAMPRRSRRGGTPSRRMMSTISEEECHLHVTLKNKEKAIELIKMLAEKGLTTSEYEEVTKELASNTHQFLEYLRDPECKDDRRPMVRAISKLCSSGTKSEHHSQRQNYAWDEETVKTLAEGMCQFFFERGFQSTVRLVDVGDVVTRMLELVKHYDLRKHVACLYDNKNMRSTVTPDLGLDAAFRHIWVALVECDARHYERFLESRLADAAIRYRRIYLVIAAMHLRARQTNGQLARSELEGLVLLLARRNAFVAVAADQKIPITQTGTDGQQKLPGTELNVGQGGGATLVESVFNELQRSPDEELKVFGQTAIFRGIMKEFGDLLGTGNGCAIVRMMHGQCTYLDRPKGMIVNELFGRYFGKWRDEDSFGLWREIRDDTLKDKKFKNTRVSRQALRNMADPVFQR